MLWFIIDNKNPLKTAYGSYHNKMFRWDSVGEQRNLPMVISRETIFIGMPVGPVVSSGLTIQLSNKVNL